MSILDQTITTKVTKRYLEDNGWMIETNWTKWAYAMKRIDLYATNIKYYDKYRIGYIMLEYHINSPYSKHIFVRYCKRIIRGIVHLGVHLEADQKLIDQIFEDLDQDLNTYEINSVEDLEQTIKVLEINLNQKHIIFETKQSNE